MGGRECVCGWGKIVCVCVRGKTAVAPWFCLCVDLTQPQSQPFDTDGFVTLDTATHPPGSLATVVALMSAWRAWPPPSPQSPLLFSRLVCGVHCFPVGWQVACACERRLPSLAWLNFWRPWIRVYLLWRRERTRFRERRQRATVHVAVRARERTPVAPRVFWPLTCLFSCCPLCSVPAARVDADEGVIVRLFSASERLPPTVRLREVALPPPPLHLLNPYATPPGVDCGSCFSNPQVQWVAAALIA